ncbi:hypothetical protein G6F56_000311 [Rhizopus delemar]|uniref:6-phosphogluconolactonase n=1 Tax=Rhizopus stolonifer TaxID=4846 RepID=A0A367K9A6_RHIST|nr:hypothetical protein G6F56_000311 [Rhizopus delemar]RCH98740.1 hypothetical protein CU098_010638 [Rhizopus stolonifer]
MTQLQVYVSGYTGEQSKGIYLYSFDTEKGSLSSKGLVAESDNPSWLHYKNGHIYATNEVGSFQGQSTGYVSAYRVKEEGQLELVSQQSTEGEFPCHATSDATGRYLLVGNYVGGSVAVLPIESSGLGKITNLVNHDTLYKPTMGNPDRQEKSHCHSVDLDPVAECFLFVNDLGCDLLAAHRFQNGTLQPHSTFVFPKGTGPRHLKFAPNHNHFVYVVGELSNEVFMLEFDFEKGEFLQVQSIAALPEDFKGENLGSEIEFSPNGKFLYVSMRGYDALTIFEVNEWTGKLSLVGYQPTGGKYPRHFTIDPTGQFLLVGNKDSNNIVVFKLNSENGSLEQVSTIEHVEPTCVRFSPSYT